MKAHFPQRLIKALLLSCFLWLGVSAASAATVTLTWNANTEADLSGYHLYRAEGPCGATSVFKPVASFGKVTTGTDTTVFVDGDYCWALSAFDIQNNESPLSLGMNKRVTTVTEDTRIRKLEGQMDAICRAAKAMGGTATTLAGRLRKEIPCL